MLKIFFLFTLATIATMLPGTELKFGFERSDPGNGVPHGWYLNGYQSYQPSPKITYTENPPEGRIITFSEITGKSGFGLCYDKHLDAVDGDKILVSAKVKGKGEGWFALQAFSDKKWLAVLKPVKYQLTNDWTSIQLELPVSDVSAVHSTNKVMFTFGASNGSELSLQELRVKPQKEKNASASVPIPRHWTVFLPVAKDFQPDVKMLQQIPLELAGVKGRPMLYNGSEFDLTAGFEKRQPGNCAWLFAPINVPEECDYTIGAGADWWMEVFVNGKTVFNTMKNGNIKHPPSMKDHSFTVKLNKGENIMAVKYLTGKNDAKITFGGPLELQDFNKKLKYSELFAEDTYDNIQVKRPGNPLMIQGNPTPGLLTLTGQGVYTASPKVSFQLPVDQYLLPKAASNQYFATGIRIQSFGQAFPPTDAKFSFLFQQKNLEPSFALVLEHRNSSKEIAGYFLDNGKTIRKFSFPYTALPADFLFAANENGECTLQINSLADSSFRSFSGKSEFFQNLRDTTFQSSCLLESLEQKPAEIVVDNYMAGTAISENISNMIPLDIKIQQAFDPVKAGWKLVFSDDFEGNEIDWNLWKCNEERKKNISLDGKGHLLVKSSLNEKGGLSAGSLCTREMFKYGYFEARVRFTKEPGWWSFVFLYGNSVGNPMIDGMEIDVYEDYYIGNKRDNKDEKNILDHNLHCFVGGILKSWNYHAPLPGSVDEFYTIGCKWSPFEISYYLNGNLIRSSANHSPHPSVTFDALNHANGIAPLDLRIGANIMNHYWTGKKTVQVIPETFMADYVKIYAYPTDDNPQVELIADQSLFAVTPGEKFTLEAVASPSAKSKAPIIGAYLFDSGNIIDYKSSPPYRFNVSIDDGYYRSTSYVRAGRTGAKSPIYGLHAYSILVRDAEGNTANTPVVLKYPIPVKKSTPYREKPQVIPGTVNPSFYDEGGNGVAYADDNINVFSKTFRPGEGVDTSGNGVIGAINTGEWLNITVDIKQTGNYKAILNFGTPQSGDHKVMMLLDHKLLGTFQLFPHGFDHWGVISKTSLENISLPAGKHLLTLIFIGGFNIGTLDFQIQE